jgi:2-phospho-L-lactate transferase/gluconeogenesis factor (CofD/UPF0052 family)
MCIRNRGNICNEPLPINVSGIFNELLPSNDKGNTHTQTVTQTGKHTEACEDSAAQYGKSEVHCLIFRPKAETEHSNIQALI